MQETSFPVVYCIVDDASTDGEQDILHTWAKSNLVSNEVLLSRKLDYGELISGNLVKNPNLFFVILLLYENHYKKKSKLPYIKEWNEAAKYCAICEGDDYWTEPRKLQMQVDFMEAHPDYVMCHSDYGLTTGRYRNSKMHYEPDDNYFLYNLNVGLHVGTLTSLYRAEIDKIIPMLWVGKGWPMSDYPRCIEMSHEGKIKYFPVSTAAYRILPNSASHGSIEKELSFVEAGVEIRRFYADYYGIELPNKGYMPGYFVAIMKIAFKHKRKDIAKNCYLKARELNMVTSKLILFYLLTIFKPIGWFLNKIYTVG